MNDKLVSPGSAATSAETAGPAVAPRGTPAHSSRSILRELATITLGVLIALSFENLVQWARDRALVSHARETIGQKIADNRKEVELVDPHGASSDDVREFRRNVLAMQSDLMLEEQLARRLIEVYDRVLAATKEK